MEKVTKIATDGTLDMQKRGCKVHNNELRHIIYNHKKSFAIVSQVMTGIDFLKNYPLAGKDHLNKGSIRRPGCGDSFYITLSIVVFYKNASSYILARSRRNRRYSNKFLSNVPYYTALHQRCTG